MMVWGAGGREESGPSVGILAKPARGIEQGEAAAAYGPQALGTKPTGVGEGRQDGTIVAIQEGTPEGTAVGTGGVGLAVGWDSCQLAGA